MWAARDTAMLGVKETLNDMYCCFPAVLAAKYVYLLLCTHSFWQVNRNLSHTIQIHHAQFLVVLDYSENMLTYSAKNSLFECFSFVFYSLFISLCSFLGWFSLILKNKLCRLVHSCKIHKIQKQKHPHPHRGTQTWKCEKTKQRCKEVLNWLYCLHSWPYK